MADKPSIAMRVENPVQVPLWLSTTKIESDELEKVNAELLTNDCLSEKEIIEAAREADALLVIHAKMTRPVFESLPRLKVVVRYGIGYDTVDVDAATDNGVIVANIPDFCLDEVSDHAMAMLLACARQLHRLNDGTKSGYWTESQMILPKVPALCDQTLGIIGCGNIGRLSARKAQCFGLRTIGYDPYIDESAARDAGIFLAPLSQVLQESDFISIHALLNAETWHLIGDSELEMMKPTAYLINTARGSLIDEAALIRALKENWIAGAGLDVFEQEPISPDNPLLKMDNVIITPHNAGSSEAAARRLKLSVAREACRVLSGKWPKNVVNKSVKPRINLQRDG
jgi:D-3-phosphoglycerate dehydrogenase